MVALNLAVALPIAATAPARADEFVYTVPFHPLLCDAAVSAAQHARHFGGENECDLVVLAEGFYCRGLRGDPVALDAAIALFERAIARAPSDIYLRLELAGSIRKRWPSSPRTHELLQQARQLESTATLGAAREEISERLEHNLSVLRTEADRRSAVPTAVDPSSRDGAGPALLPPDEQEAIARFAPCIGRYLSQQGGNADDQL